MSGEAGGLILIPLALFAVPVVIGVLAVGAVAAGAVAAGNAAVKYEQEQRRRREEIRRSGVANSIGDFRRSMLDSMNEQTRLNVQASEQMMRDLSSQRSAMERIAAQHDPQAYQEYISHLKASHTQTMQGIIRTQETFNTNYRKKIAESMGVVSQRINEQYSMYINELQRLQADLAAKDKRAQEIANTYLEEAKALLTTLAEDFEGRKFTPRQLATLTEQLNQAIGQYNAHHYESAIASAKDAAINALEEIYEADALKQEWENYYKLALVLSEEVKSFIEAQGTITAEIKEQAEKASGKQLEAEIVGISIADYTDKNAKGQTRYDYLHFKAKEAYAALR